QCRRLGRVLFNAQMSGFGGEAEIRCSTSALPVLTRTRPYRHLTPVQSGSDFTRVLRECSILAAVLALGVARARPPAWRWKCCRAATGCQLPGTRDRN